MSSYCEVCDYHFDCESKRKRHYNGYNHKRNTGQIKPVLSKCEDCKYRSYSKKSLYEHRRTMHKKKKTVTIIKIAEPVIKIADPIIKTADKPKINIEDIKKKIMKILKKCKENNVDPNNYFNYKYYALNLKSLKEEDFKYFLEELQNIFIQ